MKQNQQQQQQITKSSFKKKKTYILQQTTIKNIVLMKINKQNFKLIENQKMKHDRNKQAKDSNDS